MCSGTGQGKVFASVSRLVQAGHSVVFRSPEAGSYTHNDNTGYRTYLRQGRMFGHVDEDTEQRRLRLPNNAKKYNNGFSHDKNYNDDGINTHGSHWSSDDRQAPWCAGEGM